MGEESGHLILLFGPFLATTRTSFWNLERGNGDALIRKVDEMLR